MNFFTNKKILLAVLIVAAILRFWAIDKVPVSLFGDEVDVGYQAYSILKTGRDYSGNLLPIHFHSLAEWRTPLYLYSSVPTVAIFGISPLGVRLPAAIFGLGGVLLMYLVTKEISKLYFELGSGDKNNHYHTEMLSITSSFLLAINPWHIQYSRAGFEVTQLLFFLLLGLFLFFKSFKKHELLSLFAICLALTPWVYSTAKLFTPILMTFLIIVFRREIFSMSKKWLLVALTALVVVGSPIAYSTVFGGGTARYGYISIFTDPTTESEVGTARLNDAHARGEKGSGLNPTFLDRLIHNKFTFWSGNILRNYYKPFSTEFLFIKGDLNLRHSIGIGEFYKIDALILILGVIYFFANKSGNRKIKLLLIFWIFAGVLPAVITRDGGNHATRLIIILPALIYLISCGLLSIQSNSAHVHKKFIMAAYAVILLVSIGFYQHEYWSHYPFASERWWHAGYKESFDEIKRIESKYDKVIISTANEPPWIFFAGLYEYDPKLWQAEFPIGNDTHVPGFGKISHTGKFYFGSPEGGLYDWGKVLDSKTLYLATSKEVNVNLILEPERAPSDIRLVKAIAFPSGEPAYYLFDKK